MIKLNYKNAKLFYVLFFYFVYMILCFFVPSMINGNVDVERNSGEMSLGEDLNNKESIQTIKLLLTQNDEIIELSFDDYLKGVLVGEVPVSYEMEALKAQAVVVRTYTLNKLKNAETKHKYGADMCDDINCCQAYKSKEYAFLSWNDEEENEKWSKYEDAVKYTANEIITYNGELINAFFHAHSGGMTENVKYLWSKVEIPYLVSVTGNEGYVYQDTKTISKSEFNRLINNSGEINIKIIDYTGSGRVNSLEVNGVKFDGPTFRSALGLKSTNFRFEESGDNIIFYTVGYGHGVGLSQDGANQMAIDGKNYTEIIKHFYTGVEIKNTNEITYE